MRSMQEPVAARLNADKALIELDAPYEGVAPGQACVMYDGNRVLGGGWITKN